MRRKKNNKTAINVLCKVKVFSTLMTYCTCCIGSHKHLHDLFLITSVSIVVDDTGIILY